MAKKKEAQPKEITLAEFKAWLQGVEDMQPEDWAPNQDQWARIREKIDLIKEVVEEVVVHARANRPIPPAQPLPARLAPAQPFVPVDQSELAPVHTAQAPKGPNPANLVQGNKLLTPNIDTSDGTYNSMFS